MAYGDYTLGIEKLPMLTVGTVNRWSTMLSHNQFVLHCPVLYGAEYELKGGDEYAFGREVAPTHY